mmetsp:Transcript_24463/g.49645  ORF Transcript_24463/g.49645 Transcript_24463/m.49645 type:complete len:185 (+) Transcript_24463:81-635(+)
MRAALTTLTPGMAAALTVVTTTDSVAAAKMLRDAVVAAKLSAPDSIREETIRSFYWWEGRVQNESEVRLSFDTTEPFAAASTIILAAHNYDTPMVIAPTDRPEHHYWKGVLQGDEALAEDLAATRLVACAQLSATELSVKTVTAAKSAVETKLRGRAVTWVPIQGNQPYLDWLDAETMLPKKEL